MSAQPLPASLQTWHPWLSWFAPELGAVMGDVLRRMHPLLGRFQGQRQGVAEEPDGMDDLRRKGSYEHLLASEWLLASELPDEFLRRAANSEHLFLAPRPRGMQADRLIVVIFDAGPLQLGAPRIAHLALWILLARRALEAGGELRWGLLHKPGQWYEAKTPEQLKQLLRARTFEVAGEGQWAEWTHWLNEQDTGFGEVWRIGRELAVSRPEPRWPSHMVCLRAGLDGISLDVTLWAATARRNMHIPLPAPQSAAELLRGHFANEISARVHVKHDERLSLKMAPIISSNGLFVAVPLLEGQGAAVFRVPARDDRKLGKHRRQQWAKNAALLSATFTGKTLCAVLSQSDSLQFWQLPGMDTCPRPLKERFDAPPGRGVLLPCLVLRERQRSRLFVLDASDQLVFWVGADQSSTGDGKNRGPMVLDSQVSAISPVDQRRIVYVVRDNGNLTIRFAGASGREKTTYVLGACDVVAPTVLLSGGLLWNYGRGCCALRLSNQDGPELWRVHEGVETVSVQPETWQIQLPNGAQVVGLVHQGNSNCYVLVVLANNRVDLTLHSKLGPEPLATLAVPVQRVSVCPTSGLIAILTSDRALHVCASSDKSMRLIVRSGTQETD